MRDQPQGFDAKVGHSWYELIYKPLKADIYQDAAIQTPIRKDRLVTA
ncbi:MAG: hypothetical protein HEQ35_07255 [Gloeotrichia echinulata IR180]|jgi:hypothetical protein|nr:hypothetical protein [Gloeotrichia echinulata DEX184]